MAEKKINKVPKTYSLPPEVIARIKTVSEANEWPESLAARKALEVGLSFLEEELKFRDAHQKEFAARFLELGKRNVLVADLYEDDDENDMSEDGVEMQEDVSKDNVESKETNLKERFEVTLTPNQVHRCSGECGRILPVTRFPTTDEKNVRMGECRRCRDDRWSDS